MAKSRRFYNREGGKFGIMCVTGKELNKMKTIVCVLGLLVLAACAFGGELSVVGTGTAKRQPDKMKITFSVSSTDKDMAEARRQFDERTASLAATLALAGIATNEVMTTGMDMDREFHYANGSPVFAGYRFTENYTFAAKLDRGRLERIKASLFDSEAIESLRLWYELSEPSELRKSARAEAVANAREIAEGIAAAAGVALGDIEEISYGGEIRGGYSHMNLKMAAMAAGDEAGAATSLQDIAVTDSVTIKWKIK